MTNEFHNPNPLDESRIEEIIDEYILSKRQETALDIEAFVEKYPANQREIIRVELKEYEQWSKEFSTPEQHRGKPVASEASMRQQPIKRSTSWSFPFAVAAVLTLGLAIFSFTLFQQNDTLRGQVATIAESSKTLQQDITTLQQDNSTLRNQVTQASTKNRQIEQHLAAQSGNIDSLQQANSNLQKQKRDLEGQLAAVTESAEGFRQEIERTDRLLAFIADPVTEIKPIIVAMGLRSSDETSRHIKRSNGAETDPIPLSPVQTAVRSTTPTLHWEGVAGAETYDILIAAKDDKIVWKGLTAGETHLTLPENLQRGKVYRWQVEAHVDGKGHLSPIVAFQIMDENGLMQVEASEQKYQDAILLLASSYAIHGLFDEAQTLLEQFSDQDLQYPMARKLLTALAPQSNTE